MNKNGLTLKLILFGASGVAYPPAPLSLRDDGLPALLSSGKAEGKTSWWLGATPKKCGLLACVAYAKLSDSLGLP